MALKKRLNRAIRKTESKESDTSIEYSESESQVIADYGERIMEGLREGEKKLKSISHYELVKELGEGGMGTVFLADHVSEGGIRKGVAIKVLKDTGDGSAIGKFVEEAQLLAQLSQGTIVELLALESMEINLPGQRDPRTGRTTGRKQSKLYFMVLEFVNGPGLDRVLKKHAEKTLLINPAMVGFILNKSVIALAEAHTLTDDHGRQLNLVHRDISPSNILFNKKAGITKLADFGVAKAFGGLSGGTGERKLVGKPRYMAPEQLDGYASPASDIWALGVIGFEALTGFSPYRLFGKNTRERVENLKKQFAYDLRAPKEIVKFEHSQFDFEQLSDIIMLCLHQSPSARPTSLELNAMLEGKYLYAKGLGPTNKTLSSYLKLLDCAIGNGEVVPPPDYKGSEEAKTLSATLWVDNPVEVFRRRSAPAYHTEFLQSAKAKEPNPCLNAGSTGTFKPE